MLWNWWRLAALSMVASASGCTLIGAGVGASIDAGKPEPYELKAPLERKPLNRGDNVDVSTRTGRRVSGNFLGRNGPTSRDPDAYLVIDGKNGVQVVREADVDRVAVEVPRKGWLYGGLAGAAVDTAIVIGVIIAVNSAPRAYPAGPTASALSTPAH